MNILIAHFRSAPKEQAGTGSKIDATDSAGTDGVSLEMVKRQNILTEMGHTVAICSAYEWADYTISELEFDNEDVQSQIRDLFDPENAQFVSEDALKTRFDKGLQPLKAKIIAMLDDFKPELMFVHNMMCLPVHPVATVAVKEVLEATGLPCGVINHDILSEGAYKFKSTCDFAQNLLDNYFPPVMKNLFHWTINTRNKVGLAKRGIDARIIHDSMDFDHVLEEAEADDVRSKIRKQCGFGDNDIIVLFAARIVPNKQTELCGDLIAAINELKSSLEGTTLYNGKSFTADSKITLALAGRPERAFLNYRDKVFAHFNRLGISWKYIGDIVRPKRDETRGHYALHPDLYAMADFVAYPTGWEGFGNQLLEAFACKVPATIFEYPVFKEDIGPKGVHVVSLGDTIDKRVDDLVTIDKVKLNQAAGKMAAILQDKEEYQTIIESNHRIGKQYFSFDVMRAHLQSVIEWSLTVK
jgi:glycosyltransferase involved in cell wall biosynthesis